MDALPLNFWLENARFVIYVLAALGFFAAGWLNYDSHKGKSDSKMLLRALGFFVLVLWALTASTGFEMEWAKYVVLGLEFLGISLLAIGFYIEAAPVRPKKKAPGASGGSAAVLALPMYQNVALGIPVLVWLLTLIRVWSFATKGLIKDFLGLRTAILFIFLSRLVSLAYLFSDSSNVIIFNLTREFSYLWMLENFLLLIGVIILIKWAFYYLSFRAAPQLYISFVAVSIIVFVISTVVFTGFLFSASQENSINNLKKSGAIFEYSIKELQRQNNLAAYSLSQRDLIVEAVVENDVSKAKEGLGNPVADLNVGGAAVTNRAGEVLAVAGSYIEVGESLVADPAVVKTLEGNLTSSIILEQLQDVEQVVARSAYPIVVDARVTGAVVVDFPIDQVFIDTIKEVTKLDVSINAGKVHTATTFLDQNDRRITGTEITNSSVLNLIENHSKEPWTWSGNEKLVDQTYITVYRSLSDADNINVGSFLVGQSRQEIVDQIDQSIKLTFLVTSLLIIISLVPLYLLSRSISRAAQA